MLFRLSKEKPDQSRIKVVALDHQAKQLLSLAGYPQSYFTVNNHLDVCNNIAKAVFYIHTYIDSDFPNGKCRLLKIMVDL